MLGTEDLQEIIAALENHGEFDPDITLRTLAQSPQNDTRLLPSIEALLADRTPCLIGLPYSFGERRWLAALALAEGRAAAGINEPVHLSAVVAPLSSDELGAIGRERAIKVAKSGIEGDLEAFAQLRELGVLPQGDLDLNKEYPGSFCYTPHERSGV